MQKAILKEVILEQEKDRQNVDASILRIPTTLTSHSDKV